MKKRIFCSVLLLFFVGYCLLVVYIHTHAFMDTSVPSDALIVLGTRPNETTPNPCLVARVRHAVTLHQKGLAPYLLFAGGTLGIDIQSEAAVMKTVAEEAGGETKNMLLEDQSTSTYENLLFSMEIMQDHAFDSVIIVSDPYHLPRAALIAQKLGIQYSLSPVVESPCTTEWHNKVLYAVLEPLKIVYYKLTGKI